MTFLGSNRAKAELHLQ